MYVSYFIHWEITCIYIYECIQAFDHINDIRLNLLNKIKDIPKI